AAAQDQGRDRQALLRRDARVRADVLLSVEGGARQSLRRCVFVLDRRGVRQHPEEALQQDLERGRLPALPQDAEAAGHLPEVHQVLRPRRPAVGPAPQDPGAVMATLAAKRWVRHEALLADGDWHVHSRWSNDAQGTIHDYCAQARANHLKLIAFTE